MKTGLLLLAILWGYSAIAACDPRIARFSEDCAYQERAAEIKQGFERLGIDYARIAGPRAMRFIGRRSWEKHIAVAKAEPWKIYEPAPMTWVMWERGAEVSKAMAPLLNDHTFELKHVQRIHQSAMDKALFTKASYFLKGARRGKIRASPFTLPPEFSLDCDDKASSEAAALIKNFDLNDFSGRPLISGFTHLCPDGVSYSGHVRYMPSRRVPREIKRWVSELSQWLRDYEAGKSGVLSPTEAAADFQRWFVSIHPFGDGNGRTSRFIQDLILDHAGLVPVISGDLGNDVLTAKTKYRSDFKRAMESALGELEECLQEWQQDKVTTHCEVLPSDIENHLLRESHL